MDTSRRKFLIGCSAAIAAYSSRSLVHAGFIPNSLRDESSDILVVVFLRGGMDGLHLLAPVDDKDYIEARPVSLRMTDSGEQAGLQLTGGPQGLDFRLHKNAAALEELYDARQLAFIHACGLTNGTRSHFEAMDLVERGVSETSQQKLTSGWLTRHLQSLSGDAGLLPAFSGEDSIPTSLLGYPRAAAARESTRFGLWWGDAQRDALDKLYTPGMPLHDQAQSALSILKEVHSRLPKRANGEVEPYKPRAEAKYPGGPLAQSLQTIAQMIKLDLGVRVATVDYGGWDTHQNQSYLFPVRGRELSESLAAFYRDMDGHQQRLTVMVHSEFGRRLKANKSDGTDHGHGSVMMLLGGNVEGGRIHGTLPGLATEQLDSRADLAVTTDVRQVIGEVILRRQANARLGTVFPGLKEFKPLNLIRGGNPAPIL